MKIAKHKAEEIAQYYIFHKKIELIFTKGLNHFYKYLSKSFLTKLLSNSDINECQNLYLIEDNFIKNWKKFVNYENAKKNLDAINVFNYNNEDDYMKEIKERCDNMLLTGEINNDSNNMPEFISNSDTFVRNWIHKLIFNLENFDLIIDEKTLSLFFGYAKDYIRKSNIYKITGLLLDKMIALLIIDERKMKFFFHFKQNLLQLTADFNIENGVKLSNDITNYSLPIYEDFYYSKLLKCKSDEIINEFIKLGIFDSEHVLIKTNKGEIIFDLKNDTLYNANNNKKIKTLNIFSNINNDKYIGLKNIGKIYCMNPILQNLIKIEPLSKYFFNEKNYSAIMQSPNNFELTSIYCELVYNLCSIDNNTKLYEPKNFKEIINRKNPLFENKLEIDGKDFILFLLKEMNSELKILEKNNNINMEKKYQLFQTNQNDKQSKLNNFKKFMNENNRSIISKLFYIVIENITHCQGCNFDIFNYEVSFFIEFSPENIYKFGLKKDTQILNSQDNKIHISLLQCFNDYCQKTLLTGENKIYCNKCKTQNIATYENNIFSFPPILIIILNRSEENAFKYEVDFPSDLNLKDYCKNFEGNINYKLKGVISYLEPNQKNGNLIAYCFHKNTHEWFCYNDAVVTKLVDQINGYKNGTPYILFYEGQDNYNNFLFPDNTNNTNCDNNLNIMNTFNNWNNRQNIGIDYNQNIINMNSNNNYININPTNNYTNIVNCEGFMNNNNLNNNLNQNFNYNFLSDNFNKNNNVETNNNSNQNFNYMNNSKNIINYINTNNNMNDDINNNNMSNINNNFINNK